MRRSYRQRSGRAARATVLSLAGISLLVSAAILHLRAKPDGAETAEAPQLDRDSSVQRKVTRAGSYEPMSREHRALSRPAIRGRARTAAGQPIAGADICVLPAEIASATAPMCTSSDRSGGFVIDVTDAHIPGTVVATREGYVPASQSVSGRDAPIDLVLAPGGARAAWRYSSRALRACAG